MKRLMDALEDMGMAPDEETMSKFQRYMELILEWNEKVNLTSITEKDEFIIKHYMDSVSVCGSSQMKAAQRIIDVGTGAGFPGIPLAILFPEKRFLLMDSLNKRIRIIAELAREIGLKNVEFRHGRAEELANDRNCRERFDLCVSRAVAHLAVLSEYCLPFVSVGGWFAAYKTEAAEEELHGSQHAIELLGGRLEEKLQPNIKGY
ncbi:MAG TPA: 16S rRNA (guanine(527)-N(7))-methyltransferase RsmG, partial [Anaerovoracaceae bacterium]|nr:16S rRNA (guanine(527)-N(7))-methyltransferase RsmG [Anaerovoracaceae bacterium]